MRSEERAAILSSTPQVIVMDSVPSPRIAAEINGMLCKTDDANSCFYDEHTRGGAPLPTIKTLLSDSRVHALVGRGRVFGVVAISKKADAQFVGLRALCVAHDVRGQRHGDALLNEVKRNYHDIELSVWLDGHSRDRLLRFYRRHGFSDSHDVGRYRIMRHLADPVKDASDVFRAST